MICPRKIAKSIFIRMRGRNKKTTSNLHSNEMCSYRVHTSLWSDSLDISVDAHANIRFLLKIVRTDIKLISKPTNRLYILSWNRILFWNFYFGHTIWWKFDFWNLCGRITKISYPNISAMSGCLTPYSGRSKRNLALKFDQ